MSEKIIFWIAVSFWIIFGITACLILWSKGFSKQVTVSYIAGAMRWLHSENLYNNAGRGFIYLPTSAIFYIPFSIIPFAVSEILWRLISLGALALAIFQFAKLSSKRTLVFLLMTLVTIPASISCARNGQFNIILLAMMLFAITCLANKRWWWATFFLLLGFALKPTMIILLLLLWVLYRPLWWRIPIGLLVVLAVPFLAQTPSYVAAQYHNAYVMLKTTANVGYSELDWAQIFCLLAQFGLYLGTKIKLLISTVAAVATLGLGYYIRKKFSANLAAILLFAIAGCYLMLFNPRTENNDYLIIAPAIGWLMTVKWEAKRWLELGLLLLIALGIILTYYISITFFPGHYFFANAPTVTSSWCAPLMGLLFTVLLIKTILIKKELAA